MINNTQELSEQYFGLEVALESKMKRALYKGTDCGAWIEFDADGVRVGSIVEGCDFGTASYNLKYPFEKSDLEERLQAIEKEADAVWKWANEQACEGDAPDVVMEYLHLDPIVG